MPFGIDFLQGCTYEKKCLVVGKEKLGFEKLKKLYGFRKEVLIAIITSLEQGACVHVCVREREREIWQNLAKLQCSNKVKG